MGMKKSAVFPDVVSPGGGDQAQRYLPASLSSESGESLRHVDCYSAKFVWEADRSMVMRSPCATTP